MISDTTTEIVVMPLRGDVLRYPEINNQDRLEALIVIIDSNRHSDGYFWEYSYRYLDNDKQDSDVQIYKSSCPTSQSFEKVGKMIQYAVGTHEKFHWPPPEGLGEFIPDHTHADQLPPDNPLRNMQYWNACGGKNLTAIACAEWLKVHITKMNKELPCYENDMTLQYLESVIYYQNLRRNRRITQKVLGTNKPHNS